MLEGLTGILHCRRERVLELNESEELIDCNDYGETVPLNCSDQFGLDNNGSICRPLCKTFSQFSETFIAVFPTGVAPLIYVTYFQKGGQVTS